MQIAKAERGGGKLPVKRNRFIKLVGADKSVNRALEAKARALAERRGYITNLPEPSPEFVIGAYHRLFQTEKSFRMSKPPGPPGRSTTTPASPSRRT